MIFSRLQNVTDWKPLAKRGKALTNNVEDCLKRLNDHKAMLDQFKADKEAFDKSLLGRKHSHLIQYIDWIRVLNQEEQRLKTLRADLSEARGE